MNGKVVFSEDFSHTTVIEGVYFLNPFAENFRLEEWA
jgi:predicted nucleic acid-binding protein